jgi:hypothetical protein
MLTIGIFSLDSLCFVYFPTFSTECDGSQAFSRHQCKSAGKSIHYPMR